MLQTASEWEDLSDNLDEYVDQRPNQVSPPTHPIRTIVQSTPVARPKMTKQTRQALVMIHVSTDSENDNIVCDIISQAD